MEYLLPRVEYDYLRYLLPQKSRSNIVLDISINWANETHFVFFFPLLQKLTVLLDLQIGSKNENKKRYCLWRNCCCCDVRIEFQAFTAVVLNSITDSIVRLRVLKFSAAAFIALTVSWLLIRITLTIFSVISFDRFTNSSRVLWCYYRKIHVVG